MAEYIKKEDIEQKIQDGLNNLVLGHDAIEVLGMIYEMPTADVAPVQEWVSIDDRLPEEGEYVLCSLKGFNYGGNIQVCKFVPADKFKDKPYFEHFRNGFPSVTHWMPLPKPPKGE